MSGEKYLYLKLGDSNCLAEYWLSKNNVLGKPAVAVYFGKIRAKTIKEVVEELGKIQKNDKRAYKRKLEAKKKLQKDDENEKLGGDSIDQLIEFFNAKDNNAKFVVFGNKNIYICTPKGEIEDLPEDKYEKYDKDIEELLKNEKFYEELRTIKSIPKVVEVEILKRKEIREIPHVLATLQCNQYYNRGTCREIKDFGAIQAIKYCLEKKVEEPKNAKDLLNFLSPYELETLLFLILKNRGLFVPAWRGGTLKNIDIIGYNLGKEMIEMPPVTFEPCQELGSFKGTTFQVKKKYEEYDQDKKNSDEANENAKWTVAINFKGENTEKVLTAEWLLDQIWDSKKGAVKPGQEETVEWLGHSLWWVQKALNRNIEEIISRVCRDEGFLV